MEGLEHALGPLWSVKKKFARAAGRRRVSRPPGSGSVSVVAPPELPDSPTARYKRWVPKEDVSEIIGSDRGSPVDDVPLSPENYDDIASNRVPCVGEARLVPVVMMLEPEPVQVDEAAGSVTNSARETGRAAAQSAADGDEKSFTSREAHDDEEVQRCTQLGRRADAQLLHSRPQTSTRQREIHVRPQRWDRGWKLPKQALQPRPATAPFPESTHTPSSAAALDGKLRLPPPQRRKQQRKLHTSMTKQCLQPVPTKPVVVSQHGQRLGVPKHVCEDCNMMRPVFGDEGTTEWRNSRWCEDCAKRNHPAAVPTHPFAEGWTYSVNDGGDTAKMRVHWSWNWEEKGKPIVAASFTHFKTVSEVQNLKAKLANSEWPQNGWTATNYAKRDPHADGDPHTPLPAPLAERDRAYFGDWTACERERQFVQPKLCVPPRGMPHVEDCTVSGCRGECRYVPLYHKPLPGGTGGPRSLQSQQERDRMGADLYIPATQEAVVDDAATMPVTVTSDGAGACPNMHGVRTTGAKRVSWEETKNKREQLQRRQAENVKLLAQQKANAAPSAARFTPPHTYRAQLSCEIGSINPGMPQSTCPSRCMVDGVCLCSAQGRS